MKYLLILLAILFFNCSSNCDDEMSDVKKKYGSPEETTSYDSDGYDSETWWYWSKGVSFTFTWGDNIDGCKKDTYNFSAINKANFDIEKVLIESTINKNCGCITN